MLHNSALRRPAPQGSRLKNAGAVLDVCHGVAVPEGESRGRTRAAQPAPLNRRQPGGFGVGGGSARRRGARAERSLVRRAARRGLCSSLDLAGGPDLLVARARSTMRRTEVRTTQTHGAARSRHGDWLLPVSFHKLRARATRPVPIYAVKDCRLSNRRWRASMSSSARSWLAERLAVSWL